MLEKIKEAIQDILVSNDVYLDDIEYVKEKNEMYLRIYIEKNNGHLDMDTCVVVSEAISKKLDEVDIIQNEYYLEVSSPGVEKPLKSWEAISKAIGKYVYIKVISPQNGFNDVYGTILDANNNVIKLEYMVKNIKKKCEINYSNVSFIRLAVKF